jgi:hypothetical protein
MLQAKLTVGQTGDRLETEADQVAERVTRMPAPAAGTSLRRRGGGVAAGGMAAPPIVHEVLQSPGQPLEPAASTFMGSRFGHDFEGIRIHTDPRASASARAVGAHAYTVGQHIVFGPGQYAPATEAGKALLAHELAHTVQQGAAGGGAGGTSGVALQRRAVCPPGVDPEEGTGCYSVDEPNASVQPHEPNASVQPPEPKKTSKPAAMPSDQQLDGGALPGGVPETDPLDAGAPSGGVEAASGKGDCYAGRNCDGKLLQKRVAHCHNCKQHVSGKSIKRPDGTCEKC